MSNEQDNKIKFRNPLFNPYVVSRSLMTIRETLDSLLTIIETSDRSLLGTKGADFIRLNVDLKINEITDELTIDRLTG